MRLLIILILLTGCSAKFDGYDPTTSIVKWIMTNEKK
tara:strand:- start:575 stop:685 length:111 start_codon:yes stop_codon:yes gene_type:complete